jgi:hypothetical protein
MRSTADRLVSRAWPPAAAPRARDGIAGRTLVAARDAGVHRGPHYRLVAPRLRLLIATTTMTTMTPTTSRASPTLWTLNPDECTDVANLKITPTTASTIPTAISPIPDLVVFTDLQPNLLAVGSFARTHRLVNAQSAACAERFLAEDVGPVAVDGRV